MLLSILQRATEQTCMSQKEFVNLVINEMHMSADQAERTFHVFGGSQGYLTREILMLGLVTLAYGTHRDKATVVFKCFQNSEGHLTAKEIAKACSDIASMRTIDESLAALSLEARTEAVINGILQNKVQISMIEWVQNSSSNPFIQNFVTFFF